jgi:hypothetical protein
MTVVERNEAATERRAEYVVRALRDREQIRALLEVRRPYAAYALGQLDPVLFRQTEWWTAARDDVSALALHSYGGLGNATFVMGEAVALDALGRGTRS